MSEVSRCLVSFCKKRHLSDAQKITENIKDRTEQWTSHISLKLCFGCELIMCVEKPKVRRFKDMKKNVQIEYKKMSFPAFAAIK